MNARPSVAEAYDGELDMLRGLVSTLCVGAREGDLLMVQQALFNYAVDDANAREQSSPARAEVEARTKAGAPTQQDAQTLLAEVYRLRTLIVDADELYRAGYASGREQAGATGWKLNDFTPVFSLSDGSDKAATELRCRCGHLTQSLHPVSLLDLVVLASRHHCKPTGGTQ